jgi:hypothetical protein
VTANHTGTERPVKNMPITAGDHSDVEEASDSNQDDTARAILDGPADSGVLCVSCGEVRTGRFCSHCGEKAVEEGDYAVRTFVRDTIHGLTSTESNTWRSFLTLITRPGQITADYLAGRRVRYLKPLQLFLFCNVIFFFSQAYFPINTFTTPLFVHLYRVPYSPIVRPMVSAALRICVKTVIAFR